MKVSSLSNWKELGKKDPYYGVLSEEKYKMKNLTDKELSDFFATGKEYVEETQSRIRKAFGKDLADAAILDFGCGVGRLTIPFSNITQSSVFGIDISPEILEKAKEHARILEIKNLEFHLYDGKKLPDLPAFDFINSYIVLQHIEVGLGLSLLRQLLDNLKSGGIMQVQLTYGHKISKAKYLNFYWRGKYPFYNFLYSSIKHRKFISEPVMQMNHYDPKILFGLFSEYSKSVNVEYTDHGGHLGAFYILQREF